MPVIEIGIFCLRITESDVGLGMGICGVAGIVVEYILSGGLNVPCFIL